MVNTYDIQNFSLIFKSRYSIYFQHKYKRKHLCKEASTFFTEIDVNSDEANEGELVIISRGKTKNYYFSRCKIMENKGGDRL